MSNSDQTIATPWPFFNAVQDYFEIEFGIDLAASAENNKCELYMNEVSDALNCKWPKNTWCWLNPPFRNVGKWVEKCVKEVNRGVKLISIWPLSSDLNQIHTFVESDVHIIHGRVWPEVRGVMLCKWDNSKLYDVSGVKGLRWNKEYLTRVW